MPYCRQGVLAGAVTDMESLVRRPATQSAARLTGCRSFLSARSCEGGVRLDGWDITLPPYPPEIARTVAIPGSAVSWGPAPTGRKYSEPSSI